MSVNRDCPGHGSANLTTHNHQTCSHSSAQPSVHQSLDELEFERGIWSAALENDVGRLRKLLSSTSPDATDTAGYTALHYAARAGHLEICRLLLSHGASVDCRTRAGQATPLHRAATAGRLEVCQLLLDKGADFQAMDADGKTVLDRAKESRQDAVVTLLSKLRTA